jgi:16S rRNA processing protein RimM
MSTVSTSPWVPIALLLRPQGRRGELLAEPLSDLTDIFANGRSVALAPAGSTVPPQNAPQLVLEDHWFPTGKNAGRIVLKLSGCDSISAAEALGGQQLLIPSAELPALDADTFFVGDLLGCDLFDAAAPEGPLHVGRVVDIQFATGPDGRTRLEDAAPLLGIEPIASATDSALPETESLEPILIPFVRAWLVTVDIPNRRILMNLPGGFFEAAEDSEASEHAGEPDIPDAA